MLIALILLLAVLFKKSSFRKGESTEDALISFIVKVYKSINSENKTSGIFVDLKKAFNMDNHSIILSKMESIRVEGSHLNGSKAF